MHQTYRKVVTYQVLGLHYKYNTYLVLTIEDLFSEKTTTHFSSLVQTPNIPTSPKHRAIEVSVSLFYLKKTFFNFVIFLNFHEKAGFIHFELTSDCDTPTYRDANPNMEISTQIS